MKRAATPRGGIGGGAPHRRDACKVDVGAASLGSFLPCFQTAVSQRFYFKCKTVLCSPVRSCCQFGPLTLIPLPPHQDGRGGEGVTAVRGTRRAALERPQAHPPTLCDRRHRAATWAARDCTAARWKESAGCGKSRSGDGGNFDLFGWGILPWVGN